MQTPELASIIAAELSAAGSDTMFGLPGGGNNLEVVGAAEAVGIRFVLAHGETAAAIMAATYGDLTGRPTACVVTRGPGATSTVNGAAQALLDRQPCLLLTDAIAETDRVRVAHQRLSQRAIFSAATKATGSLGVGDPGATVRQALHIALTHPAGPVQLDLDPSGASHVEPGRRDETGATDPNVSLERVVEFLEQSRRTVLVLGMGARYVSDEVRALVESTNVPVLTTYRAKGVVPESWSNNAGLFTGATTEAATLAAADLILAIGLDTVELIPGSWPYPAPVASLSLWSDDSSYFETEASAVGDLSPMIKQIQGLLGDEWTDGFGQARRAEGIARLLGGKPSTPVALAPQDVVLRARAFAPKNAIATVDSGAHMLVAMPLWDTDEVDGVLISSGLATMGFAVPAAIAAALAKPDRRIVCFVGDGGLGMTLAEVETIARLDLRITIVLFNDSRLSLIAIKSNPAGRGADNATTYRETDFALVATGLGLDAVTVRTTTDLDQQLELAMATDRPNLIDAVVDPSGYPYILDAIRGKRD